MMVIIMMLAGAVSARADDLTVRARVDRTIASLNDHVTLSIEVQGTMRQVGMPKLPPLDADFSVYSAGSSTNMSWVNGAMTSSRTWTYRLVPKRAGSFTIGPAKVEFGADVYSTEPIEIEIVEGEAPRTASQPQERPSSGVESAGRDVFITTSVDKNRAYVGEQVTLSFKFYRAAELWEQPRYEAPELTGFWVVEIPDHEDYYEVVDGIRYAVIEIKTGLFGTSVGVATVGPASLSYRERAAPVTFFSRAGPVRTLSTEPIDIEVVRLPPEGRPAEFGGAVGDYNFTAALDGDMVDQWKPVTLKISVAGNGNVRTIPDPALPDLPEFRIYESGTSTDTSTRNGVVSGRKTYEYVLVPQTAGPKTIPSIALSFFDPRSETYRSDASPDLSLSVLPAEEGDAGPELPARAAIARLGRDIRYIHEPAEIRAVRPPVHRRASFLLLQLIPLACLAGAVGIRKRRDRFAGEEGLERFVRAPARARRELAAARKGVDAGDAGVVCSSVSRAIVDFIGDRLRVGARGMTLPELAGLLRSAGASESTIERVKNLLSQCDLGRFAGDFGTVENEGLLREAEECLRELERLSAKKRRVKRGSLWLAVLAALLVAACPGVVLEAHGQNLLGRQARDIVPEQAAGAFREANELYAEGDYGVAAEVYEAILAGGFHNADVYYNLANARYMAGDIAQAVLGYERALRLDGLHEDAAANLEFVREQLADRQVRVGGAFSAALERFFRSVDTGRLAMLVSLLYFIAIGCVAAGILRGAFQSWLLRAIVVVAVLLILTGGLLGYRVHRTAAVREAVVVAADVPVRTGPGDDFVLEFRLHEGTKVRLREARDEGARVSVEGTDLEGWLPERTVEEI